MGGWVGGGTRRRERARGEDYEAYEVKKKKRKITLSFNSPDFFIKKISVMK